MKQGNVLGKCLVKSSSGSLYSKIDLETFEALKRIAPEGDVKRLIQETIKKLVQS
jgi:hypothetical protein